MKNNLSNMMCLDIFLSSLSEANYVNTKLLIKVSPKQNINLLSWGIQDVFKENSLIKDIRNLKELTQKHGWINEISTILNKNQYESLVITNTDKKIVWVSDGFKKMTGYNKEYVINKTPAFLQGKKTSEIVKNKIRQKILANKPFKGIIVNYRKDKSTYKCELKIFPLFSKVKPTHFLALEREVV
ncbi:PAS domain-containing protein [Tenacibaculum aestuariivivum]|uniref:PAS domain-containing protein n=1 Tax=Tenacibaculum aestuariivivum TaxID=2006131 RepID=UPI003AB68FFF